MKNLKKVLALVVVFAMMVSSVAFAAIYPDVAADADYANAVSVLSDLGMIKGDDKGNFNPDATITRAEFATMVTRLLGVEAAATGKADFTDVAADHWATGYIAMAQQQGIISGYGDGTFGPENPVKYEEAVKMLVCALGYEPMAASKGGWVAGYLTTAYQIGLLEDVSGTQGAGAPRSLVAQLCYNALDIPMMEQTGFGTDIKYEIMKKNDDHDKVTLLTKMGIYKLGGIVAANSKVNFKGTYSSIQDNGYVDFWWDDDFDSPVSAWAKKSKNDPAYGGTTVYYASEILEVGETDIADAIGNQLIVYVKKNVSKYEVLAYEIDDTSVSMTIKADMLDDADLAYTASAPYVKYFKDESASKSTKLSLEPGYTVVWNNEGITAADLATAGTYELDSDKTATIELVDFNDNNKYDVVKVIAYTHAIVDSVAAAKGQITDKENGRIDLDIDNEDRKVTVTDVNGNDVAIEEIAEGDVLAMVVNPYGASLRNASYNSLDVIVLKDSAVTGAVDGHDDVENVAVIGDKEYDVAPIAYNFSKIGLQAEGKFWIAIDGETIIGFEGDVAKSGNYAYVIDAYYATTKNSNDKIVTLEVVTKDGYAEYKIDDTVKFIKEDGTYTKLDADEAIPANTFDGTAWAGESYTVAVGDALKAIFEGATAATAADTALRTVKLNINSSNEITEITPAVNSTKEDVEYNYIDVPARIYNVDGLKLGTKALVEGAVVIDVDFVDPENTKFVDVSYFVDENEYSALFLDVDTNGSYAAAVVYDSEAVYAEGDSIAVVKSKIGGLNDEGDEIVKVTALKDGEEVTLIFDDDEVTYGVGSANDYNDLDIGAVIMYTADAKGNVDKYDVVGLTTITGGNKTFAFDTTFKTNMTAEADYVDGDAYFYGYIVENTSANKLQIKVTDSITDGGESVDMDRIYNETDANYVINVLDLSVKNANQYSITGTKKSNTKITTDYLTGGVTEMYLRDNNDTPAVTDDVYEVYYVLVRTFEGEVVDVVSLDVPDSVVSTVTGPFTALVSAPAVVAPAAPVVEEEKAEVKEEIVELEGFDL